MLQYAAFSPDGQWIATIAYDNSVRVWDSVTGQEVARFTSSSDPSVAIAFAPNSRALVALSKSGRFNQVECELCTDAAGLLDLAAARTFRPPTPDESGRYRLDEDDGL
jgi:hypothetical protein